MGKFRSVLYAIFLLLPILISAILFKLPEKVKANLVFSPNEPSILRIYASQFVHYDSSHLISNMVIYLVFIVAAYILFNKYRQDETFWRAFAACMVLTPLVSSASWIIAGMIFTHLGNVGIYGYSAIASSAIGMFGSAIAVYLTLLGIERNFAFLAVLTFGLAFVPIVYGQAMLTSLLMTLCVLSLLYNPPHHINRQNICEAFIFLLLYQIGVQAMFPSVIFHGHAAVNIPSHYAGFSTGFLTTWALYNWKLESRKQGSAELSGKPWVSK